MGLCLAHQDGAIQGFAFHFCIYNSWSGALDGCLDTFFVAPTARDQRLLGDLLALARARSWRIVFWHVGADKAPALYDR